jgi:hypothetical protein
MAPPKGFVCNIFGEGGRPKKWTDEEIEKEADALIEWVQNPTSVYFKQFCLDRGYAAQRMTEWKETNHKFAEAYQFATSWQEIKLVQGGLGNKFNSKICGLLLAQYGIKAEASIIQPAPIQTTINHYGTKDNPQTYEAEASMESPS